MKKSILLFAILFVFVFTTQAQNDTMYIMKSGVVVGMFDVNTQIDSIIFYKPQTQVGNTFTDPRDGNVYQTVSIGSQVWMAENLKYLPSVVGPATGSETLPYYYVYDYDGTSVADAKATANYNTYGVLYNWPAAIVSCPAGWHLPSDTEWTQLTDYLEGTAVAGGKLKEAGTAHWNEPNEGATNETGFTALPGGDRNYTEIFTDRGNFGYWWSATEYSPGYSYYRGMRYNGSNVFENYFFQKNGFSVRCVKN
jgi:uncharacterized protein (TIGR02145 family)